jgi:hypothetical protein
MSSKKCKNILLFPKLYPLKKLDDAVKTSKARK